MQVKHTVQTQDGNVEYTANLSEVEVSFLLEYAINSLMQQGAIPFVSVESPHDLVMNDMEEQ